MPKPVSSPAPCYEPLRGERRSRRSPYFSRPFPCRFSMHGLIDLRSFAVLSLSSSYLRRCFFPFYNPLKISNPFLFFYGRTRSQPLFPFSTNQDEHPSISEPFLLPGPCRSDSMLLTQFSGPRPSPFLCAENTMFRCQGRLYFFGTYSVAAHFPPGAPGPMRPQGLSTFLSFVFLFALFRDYLPRPPLPPRRHTLVFGWSALGLLEMDSFPSPPENPASL